MGDKRVCLILDPAFGSHLQSADKSAPIWIAQSSANNPFVSELWESKTGNITSFRPQELEHLIAVIDEHHPEWQELEIYGLSVEDAATALNNFVDGIFTPTNDGFVFTKRTP